MSTQAVKDHLKTMSGWKKVRPNRWIALLLPGGVMVPDYGMIADVDQIISWPLAGVYPDTATADT